MRCADVEYHVWKVKHPVFALLCCVIACIAACTSARAQDTATSATLRLPSGVAYDASGNLFLVDAQRNQVLEVALSGAVSVVAGTGDQGFSGDGAQATAAELNEPQAITIAADGTLYIADAGNQRVRAVTNGVINTVAGNGQRGFNGDGIALHSELCRPSALAMDVSGALLIADTCSHRVRRLSAGTLTTIAGNGTQGFGGDGGPALAAQLDTPSGLVAALDGRIFVSDTHNNRIRILASDGTISTLAGSGVRGYSGDGGAALTAELDRPHGLALAGDGSLMIADSDNQRLRRISADGTISTLGGVGSEGSSANGTAAPSALLDMPRGFAVSPKGTPTFANSHDRATQIIAADGNVYLVAASGSLATAMLTLTMPLNSTYGAGFATAQIIASAPPASGTIMLTESGTTVAQAQLGGGTASLSLANLAAGQHMLQASFAGDVLHPAAMSSLAALDVSPLTISASATPASISYGDVVPVLQGTVSGILPRDASNVSPIFTADAPNLAPVGQYSILVTLAGLASGNYSVTLDANSGSLQVLPAQSIVTIGAAQQTTYAGLPVTLTATVMTPTRGAPSGTVTFTDSGMAVASGSVINGSVKAAWLTPSQGTHNIAAVYSGDSNFLSAISTAELVTVAPMPDFNVSVNGNTSQTISAGSAATYRLIVSANPGPFSSSVTFSISSVPQGATATFAPAAVVPGATSAPVTLTIQTSPRASLRASPEFYAALLPVALLLSWRRVRKAYLVRRICISLLLFFLVASLVACGNRTVSNGATTTTTMTVTATSTNLAGALVTHTTGLTLILQ